MLKNLYSVIFLFFIVFGSQVTFAQKLPRYEKSDKTVKKNFWKTYQQFRSKVCRPQTLKKFNQNLKAYRTQKYYLPIINGVIYSDVFPDLIKELKKKQAWLDHTVKKLRGLKSLPDVGRELFSLQKTINRLLKRQEKVSRFGVMLNELEKKDQISDIKKLQTLFKKIMEKSFYLSRYTRPVDHFQNRLDHDAYYGKKDLQAKKEQKKLFLLRKVLEDGAPGSSHSGSDKFFRTSLDTLSLTIPKLDLWLDENTRYDLEDIIDIAKRVTKLSPHHYVKRFLKWRDQSKEQLKFYQSLYLESKKGSQKIKKILSQKKKATGVLSNFVSQRQLETYLFWKKQPVQMRALYALETILFNEVGGVDPSGLERHDVLQVVLNRYKKPYYRRLKKKQKLYTLLASKGIGRSQYPWLNILFNRGEFSFTLYYFKASRETFCPSMGGSNLKLRKENLDIALNILTNPDWDFRAERYFSRASMTGRIDMSTIWNTFKPIEERVGRAIDKSLSLKMTKLLKSHSYRYLYYFINEGELFHVVDIDQKTRVFTEKGHKIKWFNYRNPHYFKYFVKGRK